MLFHPHLRVRLGHLYCVQRNTKRGGTWLPGGGRGEREGRRRRTCDAGGCKVGLYRHLRQHRLRLWKSGLTNPQLNNMYFCVFVRGHSAPNAAVPLQGNVTDRRQQSMWQQCPCVRPQILFVFDETCCVFDFKQPAYTQKYMISFFNFMHLNHSMKATQKITQPRTT